MAQCPSKSPETNQPCVLPDDRHYHGGGHESRRIEGVAAVWPTTEDERKRWHQKESEDGR